MPVTYQKFIGCLQLELASINNPPLKTGAIGPGVQLVQEALSLLGYPLPQSTLPNGQFDGEYGTETKEAVVAFQRANRLTDDKQVGRYTLACLEQALAKPIQPIVLPYNVPGIVRRILQSHLIHPRNLSRSTDWLCWAAGITTMKSWRDQKEYTALEVIEGLGSFYENLFEFGKGIPWASYRLLLERAGMKALPPMCVPTPVEWFQLLQKHGLLWVGASENGPDYTHSYIIQGMFKDPEYGMRFKMTQPGSTRDWFLSVSDFTDQVKTAGKPGYYQIRYYPNGGR